MTRQIKEGVVGEDMRELLSSCAVCINRYGPDSQEVATFINEHKANKEFVELARLSCTLKRALKRQVKAPA